PESVKRRGSSGPTMGAIEGLCSGFVAMARSREDIPAPTGVEALGPSPVWSIPARWAWVDLACSHAPPRTPDPALRCPVHGPWRPCLRARPGRRYLPGRHRLGSLVDVD